MMAESYCISCIMRHKYGIIDTGISNMYVQKTYMGKSDYIHE